MRRLQYNKYLIAHLCLCHSSTNQDFHEKFGLRFKVWAWIFQKISIVFLFYFVQPVIQPSKRSQLSSSALLFVCRLSQPTRQLKSMWLFFSFFIFKRYNVHLCYIVLLNESGWSCSFCGAAANGSIWTGSAQTRLHKRFFRGFASIGQVSLKIESPHCKTKHSMLPLSL